MTNIIEIPLDFYVQNLSDPSLHGIAIKYELINSIDKSKPISAQFREIEKTGITTEFGTVYYNFQSLRNIYYSIKK